MSNLQTIETIVLIQTIGTAVLIIRQLATTTPTSSAYKITLGLSVTLSLLGWLFYWFLLLSFVAISING